MFTRFSIVRATVTVVASVTLAVSPGIASADVSGGALQGNLLSGGAYVIHEPADWNGSVLVWSPGYGGGSGQAPVTAPSSALLDWALDEGYALAGTSTADGGWAVENLLVDQRDLVGIVADELGDPERVIAWGSSMGGLTSVALMEAYPDAFDAALPLCGSVAGAVPMLNGSLDGTFAFKTLLAPGDDRLELVAVQDERARQAAFGEVLHEAQRTPEGRARIALAASLAQIPPWTQSDSERPARGDIDAQQKQLSAAFMWGVVSPRQPLEARAGGNFSWNTGVDYGHALRTSGNHALVRSLYREAGLSLAGDLGALEDADRISADPNAVAYMQRNATPTGDISGPVLTVHETGDLAPTVAQARTYADRVRAHGDNRLLRQAFVDRPGHCSYSDAEVAAALTALETRLETGRWANVATSRALNASADRIARASGLDRGEGSFASFHPDRMLRPERGEG
ncbi:prolyl oligopeptidase family serine peptidase [Paramicrobacterium fandaimingii]|uniref:prolyl oligopeptidase family serine peptidase n=1 Tax=Paramicrobacterium fandaimingii TaxID=2708079 RepID=UPI001423418B|nr:prolyl oligopeptidase family serine peptidase [Microbacterium fandaimingii]